MRRCLVHETFNRAFKTILCIPQSGAFSFLLAYFFFFAKEEVSGGR